MGISDFANELKALGLEPQVLDSLKISFEYEVPIGKNIGKKITMGLNIDPNYPMTCPTGPHIKALDAEWVEHPLNIHNRDEWPGFRYWSRPFPDWNRVERNVKTYLAHIKNIMMTV